MSYAPAPCKINRYYQKGTILKRKAIFNSFKPAY